MAVAFDAVGPSATGTNGTTSPLSWTHTLVSGTNSVVLAWATIDAATDTGYTISATCGGTSMTAVGSVHANATTVGFGTLFQLTGVTSGAKTIVATAGGTGTGLDIMAGGSISFTGADQTTPVGAATTHTGSSTNPTGASGSNTNGNMIAGFLVDGSRPSAVTAGTSRFITPTAGSEAGAGGHGAGATAPATGSPVTITWTCVNDFWGMLLVEVLPPAAAAAVTTMTRGISMWR